MKFRPLISTLQLMSGFSLKVSEGIRDMAHAQWLTWPPRYQLRSESAGGGLEGTHTWWNCRPGLCYPIISLWAKAGWALSEVTFLSVKWVAHTACSWPETKWQQLVMVEAAGSGAHTQAWSLWGRITKGSGAPRPQAPCLP